MTKKISTEDVFAIMFDTKPKWYEKIGTKFMFKEMLLEYREADISSSLPYFMLVLRKTTLFYWISGYPLNLSHTFHAIIAEDRYERAKKIWENLLTTR